MKIILSLPGTEEFYTFDDWHDLLNYVLGLKDTLSSFPYTCYKIEIQDHDGSYRFKNMFEGYQLVEFLQLFTNPVRSIMKKRIVVKDLYGAVKFSGDDYELFLKFVQDDENIHEIYDAFAITVERLKDINPFDAKEGKKWVEITTVGLLNGKQLKSVALLALDPDF